MRWILLLLTLLPLQPFAAQGTETAFPLAAGRIWEYSGLVRWIGPNQRAVSAHVPWTTEILAIREGRNMRGAVVRGWIQELAWYRPGQTPGYSLLLARDGRLYHVATPDSAGALLALTRALESGAALPQGSQLVVDSALAVGHLYGQLDEAGDRSDTFYAWYVESQEAIHPPAGWSMRTSTVLQWRLVYRTVPDHTVLDFVPGLGITHYVYSHHGTVADAEVRLVRVRQAP